MMSASRRATASAMLIVAGFGVGGCNSLEARSRNPGNPVFLSAAWKVKREKQKAEARRIAEREYLEYFAHLMAKQYPYPPD